LNTWIKDKHDPGKKPMMHINIKTLSEPELDDITGEVQAKPTGAVQEVEGRRSTRTRSLPTRLEDYEMFLDSAIDDDGQLVHLAIMGEVEPVTFQEAIKKEVWLDAMREELKAI